ncbi:MAG TPA: threonine synthase, partial [Rectinemataceae bacterium]|nr:threonine synthase [Rectinemataceae bacterium]
LELFHGSTLAFKDLALSLMGGLVGMARERLGESRDLLVLVATSGDTGKAALAGFSDRPGLRVAVFYPERGVSPVQRLQMVSHAAGNAFVAGIHGDFDQAQGGVKEIFSSAQTASELGNRGFALTSANSINVARLLPQIVYYVKAWRDLRDAGGLGSGGTMDVAVPTGNFGNILAAWYAKRMGLPIGRLICASNRNHVLADFFATGRYDRNRSLHQTASPSMDILVSSNLERLVFAASGEDPHRTAELMLSLSRSGSFSLRGSERAFLGEFVADWADDEEAGSEIARVFSESGYLIDPHSAVAAAVLGKIRRREGETRPTVLASTASPFKFPGFVARAVGLGPASATGTEAELDLADRLAEHAGLELPAAVSRLRGASVLHGSVVEPDQMKAALLGFIDGGRA